MKKLLILLKNIDFETQLHDQINAYVTNLTFFAV